MIVRLNQSTSASADRLTYTPLNGTNAQTPDAANASGPVIGTGFGNPLYWSTVSATAQSMALFFGHVHSDIGKGYQRTRPDRPDIGRLASLAPF